jgi:FADH2 O2-dependent halogenase
VDRYDVVIVGSGFPGTILARCLVRRGRRVLLLEKGRHPRFAIGESSTPLGAIALERLAGRYGLDDLDALAAYGRWMERYPEVRRGLKRGFTFYPQRAGEPLRPSPESRLLVAASPDDAVSDTHWLRSDVDAFLVERAVADGVEFRDLSWVDDVAVDEDGVVVSGRGEDGRFRVEAEFVVDGSGPGAAIAGRRGAERVERPARFRSSVVFSHYSGVTPLDEVWQEEGVAPEPGPYPDERAAVHHLLDEGWVYVLPFDHDCVSVGLVADGELDDASGADAWRRVLDRYPTLGRQFRDAHPLRPFQVASPLQYRLTRASGKRWAALPHVYGFLDPMFSTGIAWSLLGVERLAAILEEPGAPDRQELQKYETRMGAEFDQVERLLYGAHLARRDFAVYAAHAQLYFALVSHEEVRQRLFDGPEGNAESRHFLGGGDEWAEGLLRESVERLEAWVAAGRPAGGDGYEEWVREVISPRNIAGLADPARHNLYPVDLEVLVDRAGLVGLTAEEMKSMLPRLRGVRDNIRIR